MSVDCTELRISGDEIMPLTMGGLMEGFTSDTYVARLGDRWAAQVSTPLMQIEPTGRQWSARLMRAQKEGAIIRIHQPDFTIGAPGAPSVAANTASGRVVPLTGLTPYYPIREGQWLNIIVGGQRYLDQAREAVTADVSGEAEVTLQNLIRVPLTIGDDVDLAKPCIEGWIKGDFSIPRGVDRLTSFSFMISEKR